MQLLRTVVGIALVSAVGCGGKPPPPPEAQGPLEARWQDAVDSMPELLVVLRPHAMRQDRLYGPLVHRAVEAARARSSVIAATPLESVEDAEELVAGLWADTPTGPGDALVVERGVPASVDPGKLVDATGHALWSAGPAAGSIRELVRQRDALGTPEASLFELPGRTWVVATGDARARARDAFAHPFHRPPFELDPSALALVRLDGPSLVARVRALQDLGAFGAVGKHLKSATFVLPPGTDGVVKLTLGYGDEDAAAFAEVTLRQVVTAILRSRKERLAWLGKAQVERPDRRVVVTVPLPPSLVEGLLNAGSAPLDVDSLPPPAASP